MAGIVYDLECPCKPFQVRYFVFMTHRAVPHASAEFLYDYVCGRLSCLFTGTFLIVSYRQLDSSLLVRQRSRDHFVRDSKTQMYEAIKHCSHLTTDFFSTDKERITYAATAQDTANGRAFCCIYVSR